MAMALITGASAGLGAEFARQLAASGHDLVLVARSKDRLTSLAAQLGAEHGVQVDVLPADLTVAADVDKVVQRIGAKDAPVTLLVNNAGLGQGRDFVGNDVDVELAAMDVMVRAVLVLSHAAARSMSERGAGAILNVSSVAGWMGYGTYAAHKAWVTSFTEGLAGQLRGTGVTVTAVLPGLTRTEFHERAGIHSYDRASSLAWLSAEFVVRTALRASARGRVLVTPSIRYGLIAWVARTAPRPWVRAATRGNR